MQLGVATHAQILLKCQFKVALLVTSELQCPHADTSFNQANKTAHALNHNASFLLIFQLSSVKNHLIFFVIFGNTFFLGSIFIMI